jgi:hypothetical protein
MQPSCYYVLPIDSTANCQLIVPGFDSCSTQPERGDKQLTSVPKLGALFGYFPLFRGVGHAMDSGGNTGGGVNPGFDLCKIVSTLLYFICTEPTTDDILRR